MTRLRGGFAVLAFASAIAVSTASAAHAEAPSLVVRTEGGRVSGAVRNGVVSFKGIPFAAPPTGLLRWRPPEPAAPWRGVRRADRYGAICMQALQPDNGVGPEPASEDCLTLNVFAPANATSEGGRPTMVWIHGGGFVNGSSSARLYDGEGLAAEGVVVVTINYRLGRFGFFAHPALTAEAPHGPLANYGLMDQIAALKWVRKNIGAFGGDPSNVTLFGESAGGMAVNRLMSSKPADGLFQKAIVESGLGREPLMTLAQAEAAGSAFAKTLGLADPDAAALRAVSAGALLAAGEPPIGELCILDGTVVAESPLAAFEAGREAKIPLVVGSNSLEFPKLFFTSKKPAPPVLLNGAAKSKALSAYGSTEAYDQHLLSDYLFGEPARRLAALHARTGAPTYLYRFDVYSKAAPVKGAVHASDREYVFKTLSASPWPTDPSDRTRADEISGYFTAFAAKGDPNGEGRPSWPAYGPADVLLNFTNDGPQAQAPPDAEVLDAIGGSARHDAAASSR